MRWQHFTRTTFKSRQTAQTVFSAKLCSRVTVKLLHGPCLSNQTYVTQMTTTFSVDFYQRGTASVAPHCAFSSYLTDRRQAIQIGNCFSDMLPTSCGVPTFHSLYNVTKFYYSVTTWVITFTRMTHNSTFLWPHQILVAPLTSSGIVSKTSPFKK